MLKIFLPLTQKQFKYSLPYNFYSMRKHQSTANIHNASWAHKHGVSKENNGAAVFGLNPNLNIEDEYIENLLKQVHFMNMEIKLLKEKQQQSSGNSLWGVINRVNEPLVKNIVDSNQKYQTMKKQVDGNLNRTEYDNMRLSDQQNATIKKMNYLEERIQMLQKGREDGDVSAREKQGRIKERVDEYSNKLKNVMAEKERESKKLQELNDQYDATMLEVEKEEYNNGHEKRRIANDQQIQELILEDRRREIAEVEQQIAKIKETIEGSQEFQRAKEDQANLKENLLTANNNLASAEFQLLQINQSIKLAVSEKEKECLQRKKCMEEYESLKIILAQIRVLNLSRTSNETAGRMRESNDIQKGDYQTRKLQKSLEEVKKKLIRSEDSEKVLRQEVQHMERQLTKIKGKRDMISEVLNKLINDNDKQDTTLSGFKNEQRKMSEQFEKMVSSDLTSNCELNDIEAEVMYLRERKDYLSEALNLKQAINQTKLQELQKVVQKNKDVNETVDTLMSKWEEIRQFSRI